MRGSPVYQIMQLWQKSGINQIGTSRHAAKTAARLEIIAQGGKGSSHELAQRIGIFSYGTADAYRDVWINILKHARVLDGTRDVVQLSDRHISSYLATKVSEGVKLASYQQFAAAAQKLAVALNGYATICGTQQTYCFEQAIKDVSGVAATNLERFTESRAYAAPWRVIEAIGTPDYQLAARLQLTSGVRISEVALITEKQLLGIKNDPYTGTERGYFSVQGKGGRVSIHHTDPGTYHELSTRLQRSGEFRLAKDQYRQAIKAACLQAGSAYHSSHGFRWNYAATRTRECLAAGNSYDKSLAIVATECAHNRICTTEHYRK